MRRTPIAAAVAALTVTATATGATLLLTAGGASSVDATKSAAYGLAVTGAGQTVVPPTPYVESTDGTEKTTGAGSLPSNPLVSGRVATLTAGDDQASVELLDLAIGGSLDQLPQEVQDQLGPLQDACEQLPETPPSDPDELQTLLDTVQDVMETALGEEVVGELLPDGFDVDDLRDACGTVFDGDQVTLAEIESVDVSCEGDTGRVRVVGASFLGQDAGENGDIEPDTALFPDNPLLDVTANRQSSGTDGSFTVEGLVIELADGEGEIVVGSAMCGEAIATSPTSTPTDTPTQAPAPTPVTTSAPVTG